MWNVMHRLDDQYPRAWFGLEYLLVRIREEICRPAIPELIKHLKGYLFRLRRHKQESMSAWALREEKVYLQLTRALTRLERTAEATEPDWAMLYVGRQTRSGGNGWGGTRWDDVVSWRHNHDQKTKDPPHRILCERKELQGFTRWQQEYTFQPVVSRPEMSFPTSFGVGCCCRCRDSQSAARRPCSEAQRTR